MTEKELLESGYRKYTGEAIDVYFNSELCTHSAVCLNGHREVFQIRRKPWVLPDEGDKADVMAVIDKCPSKALRYVEK